MRIKDLKWDGVMRDPYPRHLELEGTDFPNAPTMRKLWKTRREAFSVVAEWLEHHPSDEPGVSVYERCFNYCEIIREPANDHLGLRMTNEDKADALRQAWERFIWRCEYAITKGTRDLGSTPSGYTYPKMGGLEFLGLSIKDARLAVLRPIQIIPWRTKDVITPVNTIEFIGEFTVTKKQSDA